MRKINFKNINRRHLTLIGLIFVVAIAGYININYQTETVETIAKVDVDNTPEADTVDDSYTLAIMDRDNKRSQSMQVYRDIIDSSNCDKETKDNAQKMLTNSADYINAENTIEASIKAKGIEKNVVYIDEKEITVLVFDKKITDLEASQIKDIITEKTNYNPDNIKIIENK